MTDASTVRERVRAFAARLPDVVERPCWGETAFFHRPPGSRRRDGRMFLAIGSLEGGRARYSLPLPRGVYVAWFGAPPARPRRGERAGAASARRGPFAPHRLYAWNAWVEAVDPQEDDLAALAWAVREAYGRVLGRDAS